MPGLTSTPPSSNEGDPSTGSGASGGVAYAAGPFAIVTVLFFFWGFITVMNDVLIPFLKESFTLTYFQAGLVQFAFFGAFFVVSLIYFLASLSSGDPINRIGYQRTIVIALVICAAGCALFAPAAGAVSYPFFLGALFLLATGVTILQIAANPYAAILGRPENASARLNLAQGFNSLGTTIAPIAGGLLLYEVFATGGEVTLDAIKTPYLIYAGMFLLLAVLVGLSKLPSIGGGKSTGGGSALAFPQLRLGMAAIFLYVGAEVAIGSYLVSFMSHESVMGFAEGVASGFLAYYWGGAMIGRLCGAIAMSDSKDPGNKPLYMVLTAVALSGLIYLVTAVRFEEGQLALRFMPIIDVAPYLVLVGLCLAAFAISRGKPAVVLAVFSVALVALLLVAAVSTGKIALWAALGAGLFNSIMWSNIFTLAIDDLGEHTSQGSSLLVMMIVGGALIPLAMGHAADLYGIRAAFFVPVLSYVYIAFYGWWSHQRLARKHRMA
ncbi:L-fucose-proton symporter [Pirellulimonas nuda]|uniref:L-fucose-proton symporter n=1 Tax=Pirellulimonas nuda TaxID=2528009 RepID=A0A518D7X4_9BACT|nr:sugar MFS transporter [Pirellulimonas nuda]QDU87555.1 L-fucose-proton symporter [Pirellulimonas nuda]